MMFYTVISGWLNWYFVEMTKGRFQGLSSEQVSGVFEGLLYTPDTMILYTIIAIAISAAVCAMGERVTKIMMLLLENLFFCTRRYGWGWDNFYKEASTGKGLPYPKAARKYVTYVLPVIVLLVMIGSYVSQ